MIFHSAVATNIYPAFLFLTRFYPEGQLEGHLFFRAGSIYLAKSSASVGSMIIFSPGTEVETKLTSLRLFDSLQFERVCV